VNFEVKIKKNSTRFRRESVPIIQTGRRGSLVSKHNPNRRLSHQEWDELKKEKILAQAEQETKGLFFFLFFQILF